jgi:hypothetical protein
VRRIGAYQETLVIIGCDIQDHCAVYQVKFGQPLRAVQIDPGRSRTEAASLTLSGETAQPAICASNFIQPAAAQNDQFGFVQSVH